MSRLGRYKEAKSVLRKILPVEQRLLGKENRTTFKTRCLYARVLYCDPGATLDDVREAVTTLEEIDRAARRVLGGAHPTTTLIEDALRDARSVLRARETTSPGSA